MITATVGAPRRRKHERDLEILRALTSSRIRYALLRGGPGQGDDLDLLVHARDTRRLRTVLMALGLHRAPSEHHWPHVLYAGCREQDDGQPAVVDVLDRVVVGGRVVGGHDLTSRLVDRATVDASGVRRLHAADAAWVDLLAAAGRPAGPTRAVGLLLDSPVAGALAARHGDELVARVRRAEADGSCADAAGVLRAADRTWSRADRGRRALARWAGRVPGLSRSPVRRGACVALLGPDGAGKSTLAEGLRQALPLPVHVVYMGVFRADAASRRAAAVPGAALALRLVRLRARVTVASWLRRRGHVVVFDRYTYDATLRPGARGRRARVSYWLLERACPPPDLVLLLDAPGELMFARKGEHDVATLEQRRGWYRDLLATIPSGHLLDATQPADDVLAQAAAAVWRTLPDG